MEKTYFITTFGCQMNERDSETIAGLLCELGYSESKDRKSADVAIINTCSVRDNADKRFFGTLGQLKKIKEVRPEFIACVCGCMMQQQHIIDTIKEKYPWVDVIFGTHNLHEFPRLLDNVLSEKKKQVEIMADGGEIVEGLPAKRLSSVKALVNIMYGCNNFCTYCIVPYTRGRERSRNPEDILTEVRALAESGVKEVTLLGQNVNSYRGNGEIDFAKLIHMLSEVSGLSRIRFMTSHPKDLSDALISAYGDCKQLGSYIHLPVQSGSNRVLERMNRKYTREDYLELIRKLREVKPDMAVSTDIIVGFPGETEKDFEDTLDLVKQVEFDSAFTFLYSVRKGTPAEKYEEQVAEEVKHERFNRLVDLVNEISARKNKAYEGRTCEILIEGKSKTDPRTFMGRTDSFKLVNFAGQQEAVGSLASVKITESKTFSLFGELI